MSDDVPVKVVCRCNGSGRMCDPCIQRLFDSLHQQCQSDPEYRHREMDITPRETGREGYHVGRKQETSAVDDPDSDSWCKISERLSLLLESEEALDALAEKLNNPIG